jgi:hypothetical protein
VCVCIPLCVCGWAAAVPDAYCTVFGPCSAWATQRAIMHSPYLEKKGFNITVRLERCLRVVIRLYGNRMETHITLLTPTDRVKQERGRGAPVLQRGARMRAKVSRPQQCPLPDSVASPNDLDPREDRRLIGQPQAFAYLS